MKNLRKSNLYGLVLAGGKSRRMKKDKSVLSYHGKPQIDFCYELLSEFCEKVFISIRKEQTSLSQQKGFVQIHDNEDYGDIGPLAGILSAMNEYPHVPWLVLACDLPFLTRETLKSLIQKRNPAKMATAFISAHDGLPEPLCAIYEPESQMVLHTFLKQGIVCPRKIMTQSDVELIPLKREKALDNVNTPEEHEGALALLQDKKNKNDSVS